jgi:hypothetical protein
MSEPEIIPDAYITIDEAEQLALRIADVSAWTAAAAVDGLQGRALAQATDLIDALQFPGLPYGDWESGVDGTQVRQFPRFVPDAPSRTLAMWRDYRRDLPASILWRGQVWDEDADGNAIVPVRVKSATFMQALAILRDPQRAERARDRADGIAGQSAGGFSESYDVGRPPQIVCLEAMRLLNPYLLKTGRIL